MTSPPQTEMDLEAAVRDLQDRTLANLAGELKRLIYLSSTRDYNTGEYQHEGLAFRFGTETSRRALAHCHELAFQDLLRTSLEELVHQLAAYFDSTGTARDKVLHSWRQLQAYRVLIPTNCDTWSGDLFVTNIKVALEALGLGEPPATEG